MNVMPSRRSLEIAYLFVNGFTEAEIAVLQGISKFRVQQRLRKAQRLVSEALGTKEAADLDREQVSKLFLATFVPEEIKPPKKPSAASQRWRDVERCKKFLYEQGYVCTPNRPDDYSYGTMQLNAAAAMLIGEGYEIRKKQ